MKRSFLIAVAALFAILTLSAQNEEENALVIINGKVSNADIKSIDSNDVLSLSVFKGQSAIKAYGETGKHGVYVVLTKDKGTTEKSQKSYGECLVIVDGEVYTSDFNSIDHRKTEALTILKGEQAKKKYGEDGKNGVIIITTKKTLPASR